ncbi:hypothetical protein [Xylanimonas ulmi]|uniref:Heme peroxidase n=1 Tax=Xylanimonas ulmi TaxID=228973 RepID=A0A4V2EXU5_9MICO|nr:hypothetical protein [Xylanibacterium ulmi]RZS60710.1 hypothetical protein EV386_0985 [Xylanibacterium ulmi]
MTDASDALDVERAATQLLGATAGWQEPAGYPDSLALCAIDSVYSLQSPYSATVRVLDRYRVARRRQGGDPERDGASELLAAVDDAGGPAVAAEVLFGNRGKAPGTRSARLKSEALAEAVGRLREIGIETAEALSGADEAAARRAWCVRGLGAVSWDYVLMLAGVQGVKADTMVRRFVTAAVGASVLVSKERAESAVKAAASRLGATERALDHAIWLHQRRQPAA